MTRTVNRPAPAADAHVGHLPGSPEYRRILVALFAAGIATFVLLYDTQALLTELSAAFGVSPTQSTLTVSFATGALAVALLFAGPLSEVVGRTRMIRGSVLAASAAAVVCAVVPNWEGLLALRLVEGVVLAGLPAVATSYLREELHPSAHARAAGLYIGGTAVGGMAGRLVTAPIAEHWGWRWALAGAALLALVCAAIVVLLLPASRNFTPRPPSAAMFASMVRGALSDPGLLALYGLGACGIGALVAVFNTVGFRLVDAPFGLGLGAIGLLYLTYLLGSVSSTVSGVLADRFTLRTVIPFGAVIAIVGVLLTATSSLPVIVAGIGLLVIGFFCMHGLASGWVVTRAHLVGASPAQAASFYTSIYYVGSSVFGSAGTVAWTHSGWSGVVWLTLGLLVFAAVLIGFLCRTPNLARSAVDREELLDDEVLAGR